MPTQPQKTSAAEVISELKLNLGVKDQKRTVLDVT
jgi:hypothetical protein